MSLDVEYAVVGATVANPTVVPHVLTRITPADVVHPKAAAVLSEVANMWGENLPIDIMGVVQRLGRGTVQAMDVFAMVQQACPESSIDYHLGVIAERAAVRRLGAAGHRIVTLAEQGESSAEIARAAQEQLDGAVRTDESEVQPLGETLGDTMDQIHAAVRGELDPGLPTGFPDLDELTKGLHGGQMVIVAARPGVGKTVLVTDFMRHASIQQGVPSLMFSLEMGTDELNKRILAAESGVNLSKIITGDLGDQELSRVGETANRIGDAPVFVDDSSHLTIMDIVAKSRMWVESRGVGLIVVDYLQLLRSEQRVESREQEIASYSRAMKLLAKSCNVPVVVVAQVNRESVKRGGTPAVSDLRESGSLEQDADVVMLIDRPEASDPDSTRAGEADVHVAKNRRGRTGVVTLASQMHYSRFSSLVRSLP